jgi:maltodextrin utilization protein YvdJ
MNTQDNVRKSFMHAAGVFIYVSAVAWVLYNAKYIFGEANSFVAPVFMLLLFVVSATVTGFLVLGKPVMLYMDGLKKEAVAFLFATLAWLVVFLTVVATVMLLS